MSAEGSLPAEGSLSAEESYSTFLILHNFFDSLNDISGFSNSLNNVIHNLVEKFGKINVITSYGFLSDNFLNKNCNTMPWSAKNFAKSFYFKIKKVFKKFAIKNHSVGLISLFGSSIA